MVVWKIFSDDSKELCAHVRLHIFGKGRIKICYVPTSVFLFIVCVMRTWFIIQFVFVAFLVKVFLIYSYSFVKYFFIGRDVAQPLVDTFRYILDYSRWMVGLTMYIIWLVVRFDEWLVCSSFPVMSLGLMNCLYVPLSR